MDGPWSNAPALRGRATKVEVDLSIATVARYQWGVITRAQLLSAGLAASTISRRVDRGTLDRLHDGVYAVGHRELRDEGHMLAAVLRGGPGTTLGFWSAAVLLRMAVGLRHPVDVIVTGQRGRSAVGVRVHRMPLAAYECTTRHRIPVTTPARTVADLASVLPSDRLEDLVERTLRLRMTSVSLLRAAVRGRGHTGSVALSSWLDERHPETHRTRSKLERWMLPLIRRGGLPRPAVNVWFPELEYEVDLLWPASKLVVELDSWGFHGDPVAFEQDRRRTADLMAIGYRVLRFTERQIKGEPEWVIARLRANLGDPRPPSGRD